MSFRFSRLAAMFVFAVVLLTSARSWAIYNVLEPTKDDYGLKYDVHVNDTAGDTATVVFSVADEGKLKPFYSVELIAMSKETDSQGGHSYDVKAPFTLKTISDGRRVGEVKVKKELLDRARIRILTQNLNGQSQHWLANYEIPLHQAVAKSQNSQSPLASPPTLKTTK